MIGELLEKARKQNYDKYLVSLRLERIRMFRGAEIRFDFPVTALIGPNGGGKSTVLGAIACGFDSIQPQSFFRKSIIGDRGMDDWLLEYEYINKGVNRQGTLRSEIAFKDNRWFRDDAINRDLKVLGITRTLPVNENPLFIMRKRLSESQGMLDEKGSMKTELKRAGKTSRWGKLEFQAVERIENIKRDTERILGKSLASFQLLEVTSTMTRSEATAQRLAELETLHPDLTWSELASLDALPGKINVSKTLLYVGSTGDIEYSEFNFGAGEASVIRMVADIESIPSNSLVLIEEIENGLHPLAVRRLVDYLIDVADRKRLQTVFTTHSDYALAPLPSEAIWASVNGRLQQGKLSIEVLRAVTGRIDKRLAIFVEDAFAKAWVEAVAREKLADEQEEIGIYPVNGDGNAIGTHLGHTANPSVSFNSICFIDGDSKQKEDNAKRIFRLPGGQPDLMVFNSVLNNLANNIALLTVACQRPVDKQNLVRAIVLDVARTNRDPHLLFNQVGLKLGFVPESTIRGAFLTTWIQENPDDAETIATPIRAALESPAK